MKKHTITKKEQKAIDDIMQTFDFAKVHSYMTQINHGWYKNGDYSVPTIEEIKANAERLMRKALERNVSSLNAGGFFAINNPESLWLVYEFDSSVALK